MIHSCIYDANERKSKMENDEMTLIQQWEEFPVGPSGTGEQMHVTLNKKGEIVICAKAFEKWGRPEAASLLFDKVNSRIGLLPINPSFNNAYPFIKKAKGRHRVLRANRFCRHHGIIVDRTVAFNKPEVDTEGILVLDLKGMSGFGRAKG